MCKGKQFVVRKPSSCVSSGGAPAGTSMFRYFCSDHSKPGNFDCKPEYNFTSGWTIPRDHLVH